MRKIQVSAFCLFFLATFFLHIEIHGKGLVGDISVDVGVLIPETQVIRWKMDAIFLREAIKAKGLKTAVAYADADQSKQNRQIEDMVTKGAKVLIVGAINEGVTEAVNRAAEEGVQVIAYDRLITGTSQYKYYVSFDNFKVGEMQGRSILSGLALRKVKQPAHLVLFAGSPTDNNSRYFFDGAMSVLLPQIESGAVLIAGADPLSSSASNWSKVTVEDWKAEKAQSHMENLLTGELRYMQVDAVLSPNDQIARAVITALEKDVKYSSQIPIVTGQDAELLSINWIKNKKQYMTVYKNLKVLAETASLIADSIIKKDLPSISGVRVDSTTYHTGKHFVNAYLVGIQSITAKNYREVLVASGHYTEAQIDQD